MPGPGRCARDDTLAAVDDLSMAARKPAAPRSSASMRMTGLVSAKDGFLADAAAWLRSSESASGGPLFEWPFLESLRRRLEETTRQAREVCANQGFEPADLASPSRRAFQLLSYLAAGRHLEDHLETLRRMASLSGADGRMAIRIDHMGGLYRIERGPDSVRLTISEGFVGAPSPVLEALIRLATPYARKRRPRAEVRSYVEGSPFMEVLRQVEHAGGAYRSRPVGEVYDLRDLFDRVNAAYFGGRLLPPRLLWSERVPSVEFGHYEPTADTVRLSRRLDSPQVPRFVLEHVMHHELLHRVLGSEARGGRRVYHSPKFRREEKRFARYGEAEAILRQLASEK